MRPKGGPIVFTIGHSTRPLAVFIGLLEAHSVDRLADVRTMPRSSHNPQVNRDTLPGALLAHGIGYQHAPSLGGLRRTHEGSPNSGATHARPHALTAFARVSGTTITYPPIAPLLPFV